MTRSHALIRIAGLAAPLILVAAACGNDEEADAEGSLNEEPSEQDAAGTTVPPDPDLGEVALSLTEVGTFQEPVAIVSRPDEPTLFVAQQTGQVYRMQVTGQGLDRTYTAEEEPILDVSDEIVSGGEQGLLDIEFSPGGERLYVHYSEAPDGATRVLAYDYDLPDPAETDSGGDSAQGEEAETSENGGDGGDQGGDADGSAGGDEEQDDAAVPPPAIDESTAHEVLTLDQPYPNHNGGELVFGPDGYLYIGLGDGGAGGDPESNGQNPDTLLGTILRIDPETSAESGWPEPYVIPEDNPFVAGSGGAPEVWAYGLRNPWRFSFDAVSGDLWIGDVGQDAWEEIDLLPASDGAGRGANLGWSQMEGTHPYEGGTNPSGAVLPVYEYANGESDCAVTGGYVYSGRAIEALDAVYLFGDFCSPALRGLGLAGGEVSGVTTFADVEVPDLAAFGEDNEGEIYLVSRSGPIYRLDPG